ncbi:MAG: nucleotidyltransferase family protein [Candidatus Limnocylindria bacterium]
MQQPMRVAGVILAAGASRRYGSPKQLATVGERTMLERVAEIALAAGLAPIVAVVPPAIRAPGGTLPVINDRPDEGISRSLRLGIEALPEDVEAAVVLLGDQPTVSASWVAALLEEALGERPVVAVRAEGRIGPPVLLRRDAFHLVDETSGDAGLGPILARHPHLVTHLDVTAHAPDVDTPADLARLRGPSAGRPGG